MCRNLEREPFTEAEFAAKLSVLKEALIAEGAADDATTLEVYDQELGEI
jgi:hypothetical protein